MQGQNHIKFVCLCVYLPDDGLIQVETCGRDISDKQLYIIDLQYVVLIRCIDGQVSYCWSGYCSGQSKSRARCLFVCLFVCLLACLQILLTNTKMLDKAFMYKFLYPWLGEGLLTSKGMLVWIQFPVFYPTAWHLAIQIIPLGLLQTLYMVFHILTLTFKINVHCNMYRYFQSHTTHSWRSIFVWILASTSYVVFIRPIRQDNNINRK